MERDSGEDKQIKTVQGGVSLLCCEENRLNILQVCPRDVLSQPLVYVLGGQWFFHTEI